jgi:hypothetical protein
MTLPEDIQQAWAQLTPLQQELLQELIITMGKETNCSPYRAINTALDFMWPTRNQRDVCMSNLLQALKVFNSRQLQKERDK